MRVKVLKALRDPNSDNRLLALAVLTEGKERQIGNGILGVMQNPDFLNHNSNEQQRFFMSLAQYPSPTVFQYLDQVLSEKNITRSKKIIERQLFAVRCLGEIQSPDAKMSCLRPRVDGISLRKSRMKIKKNCRRG